MNISEWRQGQEASPVPSHLLWQSVTVQTPIAQLPKPQSWTKISAHIFEWKGAISRKNHLENSSFLWFVSASVYYLEVARATKKPSTSPPPQCSQSSWRIWEQTGDSYWAQTLPTCSCRQAALSSLPLPLAVFSQECWNFCLPAVFILYFSKFHMLLPLSS